MTTRIVSLALVLALVGAGYASYRVLAARIEADVYRERLARLTDDYDDLRDNYNRAVRETAVTELVVEGGALSVSIRTAEGELRTLPTPFDPQREIYVDYVVLNGRLWIRRLFDDATAPEAGVLVDPALVEVDWQAPEARHGKAAYRQLGEGRWVVSVTGDGSLGLARNEGAEPVPLSPPPPVRRYAPIEETVDAALGGLGAGEMLRALGREVGLVEPVATADALPREPEVSAAPLSLVPADS